MVNSILFSSVLYVVFFAAMYVYVSTDLFGDGPDRIAVFTGVLFGTTFFFECIVVVGFAVAGLMLTKARTTFIGMFFACMVLGGSVGPAFAGTLWKAGGMTSTVLFSTILSLLIVVFCAILRFRYSTDIEQST